MHLCNRQGEYLGHVITGAGVTTNPKTMKDIVEWPIPTTISKLRGILGITGYYRRFIKDYAKICRPLHVLLKKDAFQWTQEHTAVFEVLKTKLTPCPVLTLPDFSRPFVLETDVCGTGLGAVFMESGKSKKKKKKKKITE